jgi:hypothetical protein
MTSFMNWFYNHYTREDNDPMKREFTDEEKVKLRPIAETLAMLDGNAFFGNETSENKEWYEMYLPEAYEVYISNGGDEGWAGEASFINKQ